MSAKQSSRSVDELDWPDGVEEDQHASEFLRFWVANGEDYVSLRVGALHPADEEPETWGTILADVAKHAARALVQDNPEHGNLASVVARIESGFRKRLGQSPELSGQLKGMRQ